MAIVRIERLHITAKKRWLIRPPTQEFAFTGIHGITWDQVRCAAGFGDVWREAAYLATDVEFFAAHNAAFDRSVLDACSRAAGLKLSGTPFRCTVALARRAFGIYPTTLPHVCARLGIPLHHHDPLSDAEACAWIVLASLRLPGGSQR